jgi:hypothetical protein
VIATVAESFETWSQAASNSAQVAAIIIGGWWTYNRFIRQREEWPRATLEQYVSHRELGEEHTLLRVVLKVDNGSTVLLPTEQVRTDIYQILPVTPEIDDSLGKRSLVRAGKAEADWPCLSSYEGPGHGEIEPGESDEFGFDFFIPTDTATVFVYSYIGNPSKTNLGWSVTSLYDLDTERGQHRERVEGRAAR